MSGQDLVGRGIGLTGGGGHLGSSLALGLVEAGAVVVICGRTASSLDAVVAAAECSGGSGRIVPIVADVGVPADVERVLDAIEHEAGAVRGWINNAYGGTGGLLADATAEQLRRSLESGLLHVMTVTQAVIDRMLKGVGGSIVNIASMYGMVSPRPGVYEQFREHHNPPAYGAAKAGILQFTRYVACHTAGRGVRVNAVSPGAFPNSQAMGPNGEGFVGRLSDEVPMGRVGHPEELVGPVNFLLSDASSYVTGHNLVVDGGWTAW